jgi:hypothetical protein
LIKYIKNNEFSKSITKILLIIKLIVVDIAVVDIVVVDIAVVDIAVVVF